jgi:hypothetical protein
MKEADWPACDDPVPMLQFLRGKVRLVLLATPKASPLLPTLTVAVPTP